MNIFEKMAAITAELSAVAKNLQVGEGRSAYKAVGEADVLAAVKPLEAKYKVYSYPAARTIVDSDVVTTRKAYNGQETETSKFFMRLETVYRFVNTEKPDEYIDVPTYGDGIDSGDKAPGKAMTYGDKYALLKAYKVITGEDPDQSASEDAKISRSGQSARGTAPVCEDCARPIEPTVKRDGTTWSPEAIARYSRGRFGRRLCPACQKKALAAKGEQDGKGEP